MTQDVLDLGDWPAVIKALRLESHDAAAWLRYGSALLHTIEPGPDAAKQQQQAALAFVQARREGASAGAVAAAQRQAAMSCLRQALELEKIPCKVPRLPSAPLRRPLLLLRIGRSDFRTHRSQGWQDLPRNLREAPTR